MSQHLGPRTISATGGSIKRVGNYRVHTFPSEVVSEGLTLHFDAGNPLSYPGTGSTMFDLSGNGNNGSFVNGPSYQSEDSGVIDFNGVNSYITTGFTRSDLGSTFTIVVWVKYEGNSTRTYSAMIGSSDPGTGTEFFVGKNSGDAKLGLQDGNYIAGFISAAGHSIFDGNWHQVVVTHDNGTSKVYQGESFKASNTVTVSNASEQIIIGSETEGNFGWDGKISLAMFYNRVISQEEIAQNHDAFKVRYYNYTNTFVPTGIGGESKVEVLCVAGGGGGGTCKLGDGGGGGGGAGGLIYNASLSLPSNVSVSLSVGKGGAASTSDTSNGASGSNSTFGSLTAIGGGGGGSSRDSTALSTGGSGGGAGSDGGDNNGGAGTSGQGNAGGNNPTGNNGAGGGGAATAGSTVNGQSDIGNGGNGLAYSITGSSVYYAGGGGGGCFSGGTATPGSGGLGGGGNGGKGRIGDAAMPGSGGGGGGGGMTSGVEGKQGGNGGHGSVIVRYPAEDYNVEILVVAGGGGGGSGSQYAYSGGGGGAGGLIYKSVMPVRSGENIIAFVGKGGDRGSGYNPAPFGDTGDNGGDSKFKDLIAIGGGAGGGGLTYDGTPGGSGGGGGGRNSTGGAGHPLQGFPGGSSSEHGDTTTYGAGGGGFSSAGGNASNTSTASGGEGIAYSITGSSVTYSVGGAGGQGSGTGSTTPVANSGSGGMGGSGGGGDGGIGADGIIVLVYKGPQRGTGGTVDTTSRPGYTIHKFTTVGSNLFIA